MIPATTLAETIAALEARVAEAKEWVSRQVAWETAYRLTQEAKDRAEKAEADNARLRALLEEARRVVFFSAKNLRRIEGEDSVLCELVEEEQFVKDATAVLGPMPEVYR